MSGNFALCENSRQAEFRDPGLIMKSASCETPAMVGPVTDMHIHLRAWRKANKLTLERLAEIIGSKPNTISGWETGSRAVDLDDIKKLADAYGVHPAALLFAPPGNEEFERMKEAAALLAKMEPEAAQEWLQLGNRFVRRGD